MPIKRGYNYWEYVNLYLSRAILLYEYLKLKINLFFRGLDSINKTNQDRRVDLVQHLYYSMGKSAFVGGYPSLFSLLALKSANDTFQYGLSEANAFAFNGLAIFFGSEMRQDYQIAFKLGLAAKKMAEQFPGSKFSIETEVIFYHFIHRLGFPFKTSLEPLKSLAYQAIKSGSIFYLFLCLVQRIFCLIIKGEHLDFVLQEIQQGLDEVLKYRTAVGIQWLLHLRAVCRALRGLTQTPLDHQPSVLKGEENLSQMSEQDLEGIRNDYNLWHIYLLYLYERYEEVLAVTQSMADDLHRWACAPNWYIYYFYQALALAAVCSTEAQWKTLKQLHQRVKKWAEASPANYLHQFLLLSAEIARLSGAKQKATELYEEAIRAARDNEFLPEEALACELSAKFHLSVGHQKLAAFYMQEAYQAYTKWGAAPKLAFLKEKYPDLLAITPKQEELSTETPSSLSTTSSTATTSAEFEIQAIIQASQSLSGEIILEKLITKLMHIVMAYAGADRSFLILSDSGKLSIAAETELGQESARLIDHTPLEDKELCLGVIHYVVRSQQELLLNNAAHEGNFTHDPYIMAKKPKSILCLPLINQGRLIGLLYLENRLSKDVFSSQNLHILSLISSQIAISIENAYLYANLEAKVEERAQQIQQMQNQLMQQEKLASLGLLTAGIAHEIKNPLNFILNFSALSVDLIQELTSKQQEDSEAIETLKKNMAIIYQQGLRADGIIQRMLAHSRSKTGQIVPTDMHKLIEEYLILSSHSMQAEHPGFSLKIEKEFDSSLPPVEVIAEDISRVILNLLQNAYYAVFKKRQEKGESYVPTIRVTTKHLGDRFEVRIRDNGTGIPSQLLDKVFTPFFTTKPAGEGTGLGLSVSHSVITQEHGGSLSFETKEGEFTEFIIGLPIKQ